jgi:hypothetical protein
MANLSPSQVVEQIEADAKRLAEEKKKDEDAVCKPKMAIYGTMAPGDYHWQGDVCFTKLEKKPPRLTATKRVRQLAPGVSRGSRHLVSSDTLKNLTFYRPSGRVNELQGPIIVVKKGKKMKVDHPDHGTVVIPAGVYSVNYQRQYDPKAIDQSSRVLD